MDQRISYGMVRVGGYADQPHAVYDIVKREPGRADTILARARWTEAEYIVTRLNHAASTAAPGV